jgi:CheY-like chemotaxis protein
MSGTQTMIVALVLGGLVIVGGFVLLYRHQTGGFEFSLAGVFKAKLTLSDDTKQKAAQAVGAAAKAKNQPSESAEIELRSQVSEVKKVTLKRALWVDDHPDNNVNETVALELLGVFVVSATSNRAALRYLSALEFDVVITDLDRGGNNEDGSALLDTLRTTRPQLPVVFYVGNAERHRGALLAAGARAVEDQPAALISAVLAPPKSPS